MSEIDVDDRVEAAFAFRGRAVPTAGFALASGAWAGFTFSFVFFGAEAIRRGLAVSPWFALALLVGGPLLDRLVRRAVGGARGVAPWLAVGFVAPMIFLGTLHELQEPVVPGFVRWCGTPRMSLEMTVPVAMALAGTIAALLAVPIARLDVPLRRFAQVVVALEIGLLACATVRALRFPETDRYADDLPLVATIRAASGQPLHTTRPSRHAGEATRLIDVYDDDLGEITLRRACEDGYCNVTPVREGLGADLEDVLPRGGLSVSESDEVSVRHDARRGIWVVGGLAFRSPGLDPKDVTTRDVADTASPPRAWILGAAVGLACIGVALLRRRWMHHRAKAIEAGKPGTLLSDGRVRFGADEAPAFPAAGQSLMPGPVVVLPGARRAWGGYRGDALERDATVLVGTREALRAGLVQRMQALDAFVIAVGLLTMAPLAACLVVGLLP